MTPADRLRTYAKLCEELPLTTMTQAAQTLQKIPAFYVGCPTQQECPLDNSIPCTTIAGRSANARFLRYKRLC